MIFPGTSVPQVWQDDRFGSFDRVDCEDKIDHYCTRPEAEDSDNWSNQFPECEDYCDRVRGRRRAGGDGHRHGDDQQ